MRFPRAKHSPAFFSRVGAGLKIFLILILIVAAFLGSGCSRRKDLSGRIKADGSSTVFPITEAVAEEFQKENPKIRVTVGLSGTGGGFEKFARGETDISNASRPIKEEEKELAAKNGIEYLEFEVAFDGLSVVVNPKNKFVEFLTVTELKKLWQPGSKISRWKDLRPEWPDEKIVLFGPGTDSGTFDYFTEAIVGKEDASRADYTASEDDNVLVEGVATEEKSLGYFGYAYYIENKDKLKLLAIDDGKGAVLPTEKTIRSREYSPLSRPLYIYVSKESLKKQEVQDFVRFYLEEVNSLLKEVGYVSLPKNELEKQIEKLKRSQ
ncbi:MAG TPA: PstS family phosphate ABC transporter substrate-binding protein [Candidatus Subteraquimicrobiales bacterium]